MEWKYLMVFAVAVLLVSPAAFAREAESGGGSNSGSGRLAVSSITGAAAQVDFDDDGTRDQGSGDVAVSADASATAAVGVACPAKTMKVKCDGTQTAREWRGSDGCKYECAEGDDLVGAVEISSTGAAAISADGGSASSTSSDGFVKIAIAASPQEAQVGDTLKVAGTVGFDSPSTAAQVIEKKFKVEIKMTGMEGSTLSGSRGAVKFESADDGTESRGRGSDDDFISATVRAVASVFGQPDDGSTDAGQEEKSLEDESSDDSRRRSGTGSSVGAVTTVSASNSGSASQEVTEYIVLRSGESKDVVAYFKARTPGIKIVKMEVYESAGFDCPASATPSVGAATPPCRESFRKVAEAATKVSVRGELPPPPPGTNNSTNATVASGVIQISSGWNMVSVPVMANVLMQRVQEACGSQEFAWRLTADGYVKERTLVPGYGYWIKASQDCKLDVSAGSYSRELAQLSSGWNLVGAPGQEVQLSGFKGNCDITAGPWYYQNPSLASSANPYVLSSAFSPGKAYWVKVSGACTLGSTEDQPPVPPA